MRRSDVIDLSIKPRRHVGGIVQTAVKIRVWNSWCQYRLLRLLLTACRPIEFQKHTRARTRARTHAHAQQFARRYTEAAQYTSTMAAVSIADCRMTSPPPRVYCNVKLLSYIILYQINNVKFEMKLCSYKIKISAAKTVDFCLRKSDFQRKMLHYKAFGESS